MRDDDYAVTDNRVRYCEHCYGQCLRCRRIVSTLSDGLGAGICLVCRGVRNHFVDLRPFSACGPCFCARTEARRMRLPTYTPRIDT